MCLEQSLAREKGPVFPNIYGFATWGKGQFRKQLAERKGNLTKAHVSASMETQWILLESVSIKGSVLQKTKNQKPCTCQESFVV